MKLTYDETREIFYNEDAAREFIEKLRWSDSIACAHCACKEIYKLTPKSTSVSGVRKGVYKCKKCRKQFTVTVGTIFEDSKIPLHKWLKAFHLVCSSKKGISAHQLHRTLEITYKSAWFMAHRIRYAMTQNPLAGKLKGIVEVDETYVGGKSRQHRRGRGSERKTPVVALVERNGNIKTKVVERVTAKELKSAIRDNVHKKSTIMTDEWRSYRGIGKEFKGGHKVVNHGMGEYVRGDVYTNTAESYFSLLKRGVTGTFHHVSKQHLEKYCGEFSFRWNNRKTDDFDRMQKAVMIVEGKRLTYKQPKEALSHC